MPVEPICVPAPSALTLTRAQAATRQVEAAIEALVRGNFDVAITLAGAAEEMFDREGPHMFRFLRDHPKAHDLNEAKEWVLHLNRERNWLKHSKGPESREISRAAAVSMIARAASKLEHWTPPIEAFRIWLIANRENAFD